MNSCVAARFGAVALLLIVPLSSRGDSFSRPIRFEPVGPNYHLHLNGIAWHLEKNGFNEKNWGAGFHVETSISRSAHQLFDGWRIAYEFETFRDSHRDWGVSAGISARKPLGEWISLGLNSGIIYQEAYSDAIGLPALPFMLPFVETSIVGSSKLRVTYCPPIDRSFHVLMFQITVPLQTRGSRR